ncbi:MAG: DUF3365 domain-containing protein [Erythrobacter sp.]
MIEAVPRAGLAAASLVALAACVAEPEAPAPQLDEAAVLAASLPVAQAFQAELKAQLQAAIEAGGPKGGVSVCQQAAPAIAAAQSQASGAEVRRVAEKHRNPAGGVPMDLREAYAMLAARPLVEGKPNRLVVQTGSGSDARVHFLSAIPMQEQPCSVCHGTQVEPALREHIEQLYPGDLATGFQPGALRGALVVSWDAAKFLE